MTKPLQVEQALPEDREGAFSLLFGDLPEAERRERAANALKLIDTGELNPAGLFVLKRNHHIHGTLACLPVPGASGMIWPPRVVEHRHRIELEDLLVRHAFGWLREQGAKIAQCLLAPEEMALAEPLERNGMGHITSLLFLSADVAKVALPRCNSGQVSFVPYDSGDAGEFHATLARTYGATLDCPEVSGLRTIEEIVAGHNAQGKVPAGGWVIAKVVHQPVGVLLLVELSNSGQWDVAYLGVVPEARRKGIGKALMHYGLALARDASIEKISLSVDGRNKPAQELYVRTGFRVTDRREVYLASW